MRLKSPRIPDMPHAAPTLKGREIFGPLEVFSGSSCELLSSGSLLRPRDLISPLFARIVIHGWFQRLEYFRGAEGNMRSWFHQEDVGKKHGIAVCLRSRRPVAWCDPGAHAGRAKAWEGASSGVDTVVQFLHSMKAREITVFSDGPPDESAVRALAPYGYTSTWYTLDTVAAFRHLRSFELICASAHHPFEWWAAFLNTDARVLLYDPYLSGCAGGRCLWTGGRALGRPNLFMREGRFHYA